MDTKDAEFLTRLLAIFKVEAEEHLGIISTGLVEMEKSDPGKQSEIVERIYRESHSLKGAARSVNLANIVSICQAVEAIFSALKHKEIKPTAAIMDLLHRAVNSLGKQISGEEPSAADKATTVELLHKLDEALTQHKEPEASAREEQGKSAHVEPEHPAKGFAHHAASSETVRISTVKLDAILLQAEEMLSVKLATAQRATELRELKKEFAQWKKEAAKNRGKGHASPSEPFAASWEHKLTALLKTAEYDQRSVGMMVDNLLYDMKKALMLPMAVLLAVFPKLVRDQSRDAGKEVELTITGAEIETDRRIMEEMKDPLIHLIRNSIDHGIEMPDERGRKKKPACGHIKISASSKDNKMEIEVSDDGAGIDVVKVKSIAVKNGVLSQEEADRLSNAEAALLIFRSGVSTSPIITDLSGRGLGLAIVREKVEKLNGTITIDTQPDVGTTFRLVIPITLATFRGVFVKIGEHLFVIPSANVVRVARVKKEEVRTVENRETLSFDGHILPLARLGDVLKLNASTGTGQEPAAKLQVVILGSVEKRMAFLVDEILHEQEVLVKPLGRQLARVRNISSATVLGNGKVVPILNVPDLMKSTLKVANTTTKTVEETAEKRLSILVAEDSITARTLLKNILDSAGYDVKTAVDGVDAFTALHNGKFDLVVSDVDMPRMSGFDLTAKIRADKKLAELPVILVTALESREDRERGVGAGANAYIVKSSFDQSNLLEVIKECIP